jgi:hypothetical protein
MKVQSIARQSLQNEYQNVVPIAAIFEVCSMAVCVKICNSYITTCNYKHLFPRSVVSCAYSAKLVTSCAVSINVD